MKPEHPNKVVVPIRNPSKYVRLSVIVLVY